MLPREKIVEVLRQGYPHLVAEYGVSRIGLFGSYAKGQAGEASDVDIVVEYFLGPFRHSLTDPENPIDPGDGRGTALTALDGAFGERSEDVTFAIGSSGLHPGLHSGGIRFKNSDGEWGVTQRFDFRVDADARIAAGEAFVGPDPGAGRGTPLRAKDGAFDEAEEVVDMKITPPPLSQGLHDLSVRFRDQYGAWGDPRHVKFEVVPALVIVKATWATDSATSCELGQPMDPTDGAFDSDEEEAQTVDARPVWGWGKPREIYVSFKDSFDRWVTAIVHSDVIDRVLPAHVARWKQYE